MVGSNAPNVSLPERSSTARASVLADGMEKPLLDNRTYRVVRLPNDLEALLIHDPDTDKASAAMDVNIGSFSDADDMPGMAHAVEHLLFMGTEKFPVENEYNQYLQRYGGYSNAFTASCDTNYYFELSASATSTSQASSVNSRENLPIAKAQAPLYGALDRFAQFFIHPLFLEDTLDRELRAVDSENKKNLQADNWRLHQLNKNLSNKKHPFNKFSTGNYKVLHDDPIARGVKIRDAFINFYRANYSANRMKLAVLGRESLDELEAWVTELFSDVPNQNLPKLRWDDVPAMTEAELGTQIFVKPVMDMRLLDLHFTYVDEEALWESQPSKYLSHLIGHEGPGSILAYIKAKGWANGLGAGPMNICPGTSHFSISIRLTEDGLKNYHEIVKAVFQYLAMVKEQPPQEWIVDEMAKLAEVDFRFRQKIPASRTVSALSGVMQKSFPREKLLSAQSLIWKFDPGAIKRGLDMLTPDNFRITLVSQDYPGDWDQKEQWYGTEYKYEKMPAEFMKELQAASKATAAQRPSALHLPAKNEFVPSRLDVEVKEVEMPAVAPKLIRNDENIRTWWKKDDQFWAPKANIKVFFRSPLVSMSALTAITTQLYKDLVEDSLTEYSYDAELAGLEYDLMNHSQGFDVTISGYNDKMSVLLEKVLVAMRDLDVKDDRFNIVKDRTLRGWRNFGYQQPFHQIGTYSRWLVTEKGFVVDQLLEELDQVTAEDIRKFFPQALHQMHIEVLAHGNLYREDALKMTDLIESTLKPKHLPAGQWPLRRSIIPPQGSNFVYERTLKDPQNVNHCIDYQLFTGLLTDRSNRAKLLLFAQMSDEGCFDTLRSKEQLGYVVQSMPLMLTAISGWRVLIQSEKSPDYLEKRIDVFLNSFGDNLKNSMSDEEFESHKTALINKRLEKLKNLNQESGRFWHHVTSEAFDFELVYRDVEHIEPITKQDMIDFFNTHIDPASKTRAKISTHMLAQAKSAEIAGKKSPSDKTTELSKMISQYLTQEAGIQVPESTLANRLSSVDVAGGDTEGIIAALEAHLSATEGLEANQVQAVMQSASTLLNSVLPSLGIKPQGVKDGSASVTSSERRVEAQHKDVGAPEKIEDVRRFKASMPLSEAMRPVKELSEFEDLGAKL